MGKTLYDAIDWRAVEEICYGESDDPHRILGPHKFKKKILVQAFFPTAKQVFIIYKKNKIKIEMECQENSGFFVALISEKTMPDYMYQVVYENRIEQVEDAYRFDPVTDIADLEKFNCGIHYSVYEILGARVKETQGVKGVLFTVWAPNAVRVSVVGDFNEWNSYAHQMRRLWESGVFELFIPGLDEGCIYKFAVYCKGGKEVLKSDPYAFRTENNIQAASIVHCMDKFQWTDQEWLLKRGQADWKRSPMSIYEVHLDTFEDVKEYTYKQLAEDLAFYANQSGYTHIALLPVMFCPEGMAAEFYTYSFYAPSERFGTPEDFKGFINCMHKHNLGVILDWSPSGFPLHEGGLAEFDGTCLYEHKDRRQGYHPAFDLGLFNYARPEVKNFLIASVFFWLEYYHVDGIRVHKADAVLYLDYNKREGEWLPNMYGGNENTDGIELFKHLNSVLKKKCPDVLLLAEDHSAWPFVTESVEQDGLGFDLKMNAGWQQDMTRFMQLTPLYKTGAYECLTNSMLYQYSEQFVQCITYSDIPEGGALRCTLPGEEETQFAAIRAWYSFLYMHPGKKLLFMGEDLGQMRGWNSKKPLYWRAFEMEDCYLDMRAFIQKLNKVYKDNPALYELDFEEEGFQWINAINPVEAMITFLRKGIDEKEVLLIVGNFLPVKHEEYMIGVPFPGKYKEIFNSDARAFGGSGFVNPRVKQSKNEPCDGMEDSISIKSAPLSVSVFKCTKTKEQKSKKAGKNI